MSVQNRGAGAEGAKESRPPHFEERFTAISEWRDCGVTGCDRGLRGPHLTHTTLTWRALLSSLSTSQGHPPSRTAVPCCLPSWLLTCLSRPSDHGTFVSKPWAELRNCLGKEGSREEKRQSPCQALDPSPQPRSCRLVRDPS